MKKLLSLLLALLLIVGAIPMAAIPTAYAWISGPADMCGENITFTYNETTGELVISGTGPMKDFNYYGPFGDGVKNIVIEDGITYIGNYMFYYLKDLTSVTIPKSVTSIGDYAFYSCESLTSIYIPESVTTIGDSAFSGCDGLTSLDLPDSLITIGNSAFSSCSNLTDVRIGNSVETIGNSAFYNCYNLTDIVIPDSVITIGRAAFMYCEGLESVTLGNSIETIARSAFERCKKLKSVIIPDSVVSIDESAFAFCSSLESATIGNSVKSIDREAFYVCANLKEITIPDSVTYIDPYALYLCIGLEKINVDENNTAYSSDEDGVLYNKDKTVLVLYPSGSEKSSFTVPESVKTISSFAFVYSSNLKNLTIPGNVEKINMAAVFFCLNLEEIIISGAVDSIDQMAFFNNLYLKNIIIEDIDVILATDSIGRNEFKVIELEREEFINFYTRLIKAGMQEYVFDEFEDYIVNGAYYFGTIQCHAGSTAEAYAIETGMDYELVHFYEDEWHNGEDENVCRWRKCIHCDEMEVIEHNMSDFVITKEATCTEKGEERATCTECDYYEIREIPIKEHTDEDLDGYCDSCNEYIADEDCLCICHAKTIGALVYKIFKAVDKVFKTRLVEKVFGITDICVCGIKHK